ncbi:MAG: amino acid synthesis family protein [Granulosicoccus sp.]
MHDVIVRKSSLSVEEIFHEGGEPQSSPLLKAAAIAVIQNPFAGRYEQNIEPFMDDLKPLGIQMAKRLVDALGGVDKVQGYGKGAIVGANGELEHGALWHVPGGYAMREVLGDAMAIVPSTKKLGSPGTRLDIPVTHINASYVRSHFDAMEVGLNDGPKADELLLALVMSSGSRIHARVGGLKADAIAGNDGLR